jgi:hypothetical protein
LYASSSWFLTPKQEDRPFSAIPDVFKQYSKDVFSVLKVRTSHGVAGRAHWIGSARFGTAQSAEIKLNGNKWKAAHCIGSAQTPSAGIGTVPDLTEQTVPKV